MSLRALCFALSLPLLCQACGKSGAHAQPSDTTGATAGAGADTGASKPDSDEPTKSTSGAVTAAGASGTDEPNAQTCADLALAACQKLQDCAPFYLTTQYGTAADCDAALSAACGHFEGSATPVDRTACANAVNAPYCAVLDSVGGIPNVCTLGPGKGAAGDKCGRDADCKALRCDKKTSCGTCVGGAALGKACAGASDCQLGLLCSVGACAKPTAPGSTCDLKGSVLCPAGTFCVDGSCKPNGALGEACDVFSGCDGAHGLSCSNSKCVALKSLALGDSCSSAVKGRCVGGTFCGDAKTCEAAAGAGESCSDSKKCQAPLACVSGKCGYELASTCN